MAVCQGQDWNVVSEAYVHLFFDSSESKDLKSELTGIAV